MLTDTKKIIITMILILGMLMFITACDSDGGGGNGAEDEELPTSRDTPGYQTLGCGTNVLDEYAVEGNVLGQVLDVDELNRNNWLRLNENVQQTGVQKLSGSEISEYAENFGLSVGLEGHYKWFSASIKTSFEDETYRKSGYKYVTLRERHYKNSLKIQNVQWDAVYLEDYLTENFAEAINNNDPKKDWSPEKLLDTFGTHVMVGVYTGGRLDYNMSLKTTEEMHAVRLYAEAEAAGDFKMASFKATAELNHETKESLKNSEQKVTIQAKGGNSQYARLANEDNYEDWKSSIDTDPALVGFIENALIPIWTFADGWDHQTDVCIEGSRCADIKEQFEHIGGQIDDEFEIKNEAEITQYMDKDKWEEEINNMETNSKVLTFPTTPGKLELANEVLEIEKTNVHMGPKLTFAKNYTEFPFDFILEATQAKQYGLVYMDDEFETRTSYVNWQYSVSIGDLGDETNDDFKIKIKNQDSGRSVFAIGLWFCLNYSEEGEKFTVRCSNGYEKTFDNVPNNDDIYGYDRYCTFVGFVSSSPIKELSFDGNEGDDIFIKYPYFGVSDQTN